MAYPEAAGNSEEFESGLVAVNVKRLLCGLAGLASHLELGLLAVAIPLLLFPPAVSGTNRNRYMLAGFALVAFAWLARWLARGEVTVRTPLDVPILLLLLGAPVGLFCAVDMASALEALGKLLAGVALYYGLVNWLAPGRRRGEGRKTTRRIWYATGMLITAGMVVAGMGLLGMRVPREKLFPVPERLYMGLPGLFKDHPNIVANPLVLVMPLCLSLFLWYEQPLSGMAGFWGRVRWVLSLVAVALFLGLALVVMSLALALTQSRGALLALTAALLTVGLLRGRRLLVLILIALAAVYLWLALSGVSPWEVLLRLVSARWPIHQKALTLIGGYFFTGAGLNSFPLLVSGGSVPEPHAHNIFLQAWVDLGLMGFLGMAWLAIVAVLVAREALRRAGGLLVVCHEPGLFPLAAGLCGSLVAFLVHGYAESMLWIAKPGVFIWAVLGLLVGLWRMGNGEWGMVDGRQKVKVRKRRRVLAVRKPLAIIVALVALLLMPTLAGLLCTNLGNVALRKAAIAQEGSPSWLKAAEAFSRWAVFLRPNDATAWQRLGEVYLAEGEDRAAAEAFERAGERRR